MPEYNNNTKETGAHDRKELIDNQKSINEAIIAIDWKRLSAYKIFESNKSINQRLPIKVKKKITKYKLRSLMLDQKKSKIKKKMLVRIIYKKTVAM